MLDCEREGLPYLFKLRHTKKVQSLIKTNMNRNHRWIDSGDGWEAHESQIKLSGWSRPRRRDHQQPDLPGSTDAHWWGQSPAPWSGKIAVLVTSLDPIAWLAALMPKQYRDRADAENSFDELKKQWGWNGYITQKLAPCRLMANLIALLYNWWNLYMRFYDAEHHREAIRSRPALMQGVARQVQSGGQRKVKISLLHEKGDLIAQAVTQISKQLHQLMSIAERWSIDQRWAILLTRLLRHYLGGKWLPGVPPAAGPLLTG